MQVRAIVRAALATEATGVEIMHPLVGFAEELRRLRAMTEAIISEEGGERLGIIIGTMIEVPRAALTADEIADVADFCSFGTNDLTQMTLAFSRDDAETGSCRTTWTPGCCRRARSIEEPIIKGMIITNDESVGGILQLCQDKRGTQKGFEYLSPTRVMLTYELPLNEIVLDFYDRLKSVSRGYASLDYHLAGYSESDLIKLDVLVGGEPVDALSMICHRDQSYERGRDLVSRLKIDPAPNVRGAYAGRDWKPRHRSRNSRGDSQKCAGQVLRRRHHTQTQAPRKAEGRQKAHEASRASRHPARSLPGGAKGHLHRRRRVINARHFHSGHRIVIPIHGLRFAYHISISRHSEVNSIQGVQMTAPKQFLTNERGERIAVVIRRPRIRRVARRARKTPK